MLKKLFLNKEKDYKESELDFAYLTSPKMIEKKLTIMIEINISMDFSKIFLNLSNSRI